MVHACSAAGACSCYQCRQSNGWWRALPPLALLHSALPASFAAVSASGSDPACSCCLASLACPLRMAMHGRHHCFGRLFWLPHPMISAFAAAALLRAGPWPVLLLTVWRWLWTCGPWLHACVPMGLRQTSAAVGLRRCASVCPSKRTLQTVDAASGCVPIVMLMQCRATLLSSWLWHSQQAVLSARSGTACC